MQSHVVVGRLCDFADVQAMSPGITSAGICRLRQTALSCSRRIANLIVEDDLRGSGDRVAR